MKRPDTRRRTLIRCAMLLLQGGTRPVFAMTAPCSSSSQSMARLASRALPALAGAGQNANANGNVMLCPLSLHDMLGLLWLATAGASRHALARALDLQGVCPATPASTSAGVRSVTALWLRPGLTLAPAFVQAATGHGVALKRLPPRNAAGAINDWAAQATRRRIIAVADTIGEQAQAVLVNAVHFLARWQQPFDSASTRTQAFHGAAGATMLPFMRQTASFSHRNEAGQQWIRLLYEGGTLAMDLLLPRPDAAPASAIDALLAWGAATPPVPRSGSIALPRFSIRAAGSLKTAMAALGLAALMQTGQTDFSPMASNAQGLAIDEIRQSVFLSVDEAGTEAAAVTSVVLVGALPPPAPRFDLVVDRPFLLAIRNLADGSVLFVAIVNDPGAGSA